MILDHVKVGASERFYEASCPKHGDEMLQVHNGLFEVAWYCEKCGYAYHLQMRKMLNQDPEALAEIVKKTKERNGARPFTPR